MEILRWCRWNPEKPKRDCDKSRKITIKMRMILSMMMTTMMMMMKMMTPPVDVYCLAKQETGKDCCAKSAKTFSFQSNTLDWSDPLLFGSMFQNSNLFIFTFCKNLLALFNQALSTGVINWSPVQSRLVKI